MSTPSDVTDVGAKDVNMRQRRTGATATSTASGAAAAAAISSGASLVHANQGRSTQSSSAHICSNVTNCPLVAQWNEAAPEDRDSVPLSEELFACSACRSKLYCSRDCQRLDWLNGHKQECPQLRAKLAEESAAATVAASALAGRSAAAAPAQPAGQAAAHPQPHHRMYNLNVNVSFGPRTLIVVLVVLYLIYRALYQSAAPHVNPSHSVG